jgi:hypothetical protein
LIRPVSSAAFPFHRKICADGPGQKPLGIIADVRKRKPGAPEPYAFLILEVLIPSRMLTPPGPCFPSREDMETRFMRNLPSDRIRAERLQDPPRHGLDRYDPYEIDPPAPLQIFTRLGVLLMIALAFGLVAEILVRLPPH